MQRFFLLSLLAVTACLTFFQCSKGPDYAGVQPWFNADLGTEARLDSLLSAMTLDEKVAQMMNSAPAIERLGIPAYNWWNDCLHGVARSGRATVFPQAIGMAATWDENEMLRLSTVISDEARAKYYEFLRHDKHGIYQGLTFGRRTSTFFAIPAGAGAWKPMAKIHT